MVNAYGVRAALHGVLQKSYAKYLRRAAAAAVFLHVAVFILAPPVDIVPCRLTGEDMQVVLIEPAAPVILPDRPADAKHPPHGLPVVEDPSFWSRSPRPAAGPTRATTPWRSGSSADHH